MSKACPIWAFKAHFSYKRLKSKERQWLIVKCISTVHHFLLSFFFSSGFTAFLPLLVSIPPNYSSLVLTFYSNFSLVEWFSSVFFSLLVFRSMFDFCTCYYHWKLGICAFINTIFFFNAFIVWGDIF